MTRIRNITAGFRSTPSLLAQAVAFAAVPPAFLADFRVRLVVLVPLWAMGFGALKYALGGMVTTSHVLGVSYYFEMVKSHTSTIATKMVNLITRWNKSTEIFKNPAMRPCVASGAIGSTADFKQTIPVRKGIPNPKPTGIGYIDLGPESVHDRDTFLERATSRHGTLLSWGSPSIARHERPA